MRGLRRAALLLAVLSVALLVGGTGGAGTDGPAVASVELKGQGGSGVRGLAVFRQRGVFLRGQVAVWGLRPRSRHAAHFHGPAASCDRPLPAAVATHADLVADRAGVAYATFSLRARALVVTRGFVYDVHAQGRGRTDSAGGSVVSCGAIRPD